MSLLCTGAFATLASHDISTLVTFYTQLLGQPKQYIWEVYAEFQLPSMRLGIFKPKVTNQQEFESAKSGMSICLEVVDLEEAITYLAAMGYPPPGDILTVSHGREIYAYDPAGNRLILHQSWKP